MWLRRRHSYLLTALLALCFLAAAAAIWRYYVSERAANEDAAIHEMSAIRDIETIQVRNWRQERLGDAGMLMSLPEMKAAERLLSGAGRDADRAQIVGLLAALKHEFGYSDISLVDKQGQTYVRLNDGVTESRVKQAQRAALAAEAREPTLSDIGIDRSGDRLITLTVPAGPQGAIILEIDPKTFLDPYLKAWRSSNRTGETFLARREPDAVVYLTELRHLGGSSIWRRPIKGSSLAQEDKLPEAWVARGPDYRGVQVVLCARRVPGSRWFLLVKKDVAEIDEPLSRLAWQLGAALALIAVSCLAGVGWIWKSHQLRMQQESEERLRSFANDTPALLWVVSAEGHSVFVNQGLSDFVGTEGQHGSVEWQRYLHPDDRSRVIAAMESCFRDRTRFSDEAQIRRADGAYRWVLGQGIPRTDSNGVFLGYAGALLDITERKEAEQRLRHLNEELALNLQEKTAREAEIRGLSARLINAQEEERRRLSLELHDDLSQQIAALSIGMGNLKRGVPAENTGLRAHCDKLQQRLIDVSESVRRMSHELHPTSMQHLGVAAALRGYCREFEELAGVRVDLQIEGDCGDVAQDVELTVFRIVQESLRNIAKHARVDRAEVVLARVDAEVRLLVADKGVGLPSERAAKAGLGLISIRERTRLVNGTIDVESAPGGGTRIYVRIPVQTRNHTTVSTA